MDIIVNYQPNKKQERFHMSTADRTVYGGAKGGGKSCALVMEALAYGLENAGAEMYLFRETYDDLDANIIKEWKEKVPKELYDYKEGKYAATLINGTVIKFRYIRNLQDAEGYQGRSMDWIGVDELTKHTRKAIQILLSCLRSPKGFKPKFRGTCNPGGIGHSEVKEDYIDATDYGNNIAIDKVTGESIEFIPATVYDNDTLMKNDPAYVKRLENLPDKERKAFLLGEWDLFDGQYFGQFDRKMHVVKPFVIPNHWTRYRSLDYGLDMLAVLWYAVSPQNEVYVYKELHESDHIVSKACERIKAVNGSDRIAKTYAPSDLGSRQKDTGTPITELFNTNGVILSQTSNKRVMGWYSVKEALKVIDSKDIETGEPTKVSKLKIFSNCRNLINNLPQVQKAEHDPNDVSETPHDLTHICDALRYYCVTRFNTFKQEVTKRKPDEMDNYIKEMGEW